MSRPAPGDRCVELIGGRHDGTHLVVPAGQREIVVPVLGLTYPLTAPAAAELAGRGLLTDTYVVQPWHPSQGHPRAIMRRR